MANHTNLKSLHRHELYGALALCLFIPTTLCVRADAQRGCQNGIVQLPAGLTGNITLCPAVTASAPELASQIAALRKLAEGQKLQMTELTRLLQHVNGVGSHLDSEQQIEMLRNVLQRLGDPDAIPAARIQARAANLSMHLERVRAPLDMDLSSRETAESTHKALQGALGEDLAKLDFDRAEEELGDIQAKLQAIDKKLDTLHGQNDGLSKGISSIQRGQDDQMQRDRVDEEHRKSLSGSASDLKGGGLERLKAMGLLFDNGSFANNVHDGNLPAIAAYLDAGMSPNGYQGGSGRFILTLSAMGGVNNFAEIVKLFQSHGVKFEEANSRAEDPINETAWGGGDAWFFKDKMETLQDQLFLVFATTKTSRATALASGKALLAAGASPLRVYRAAQICPSARRSECEQVVSYIKSIGYQGAM